MLFALYMNYFEFLRQERSRFRAMTLSASAWAREMSKILPGALVKKRLPPSQHGKAVYVLPPYRDCCAVFERAYKVTVERADAPGQPKEPC